MRGEGWEGREEEGREGRERNGWRRKGKVKEEMGGTGQDMGWDGGRERERRKGRESEERGYSPQTSIPGAATAWENLWLVFRLAVKVRK